MIIVITEKESSGTNKENEEKCRLIKFITTAIKEAPNMELTEDLSWKITFMPLEGLRKVANALNY